MRSPKVLDTGILKRVVFMNKKIIKMLLIMCLFFYGCASVYHEEQLIGETSNRRFVILREHVSVKVANEYREKYNAEVFYTPPQGIISDLTANSFRSTIGPTKAMKGLISQIKSMNRRLGQWELFVPEFAQSYFLTAIRRIEDDGLLNARGTVYLLGVIENKAIERELYRLSVGNFKAKYLP